MVHRAKEKSQRRIIGRENGDQEKRMNTVAEKKLSGHVMDETLEGYIHLAMPRNAFVVSPIEGLI